jgi:hypothetical protein
MRHKCSSRSHLLKEDAEDQGAYGLAILQINCHRSVPVGLGCEGLGDDVGVIGGSTAGSDKQCDSHWRPHDGVYGVNARHGDGESAHWPVFRGWALGGQGMREGKVEICMNTNLQRENCRPIKRRPAFAFH